MTKTPTINRRGWLAWWLQKRRRARANGKPAIPPSPVVILFQVIDDGGMIDMNVVWTWDGHGWPDDGVFTVDILADDLVHGGIMSLTNAFVACPGRSYSIQGVCVAEDKVYYCRVLYKKDTVSSDYSATVYGNPY
jgi:hypothetical protein